MKIYGLIEFTYDYYEWEKVEVVSTSIDSLKAWHANMDSPYKLLSLDDHKEISHGRSETPHLTIIEMIYID